MRHPRAAPLAYDPSDEERELFLQLLKEEREKETEDSKPKEKVQRTDIFSPQTFDDYIGQSGAKELAQIMTKAAHNERRPLPCIMVVGEYGLGKTSLARLLLKAAGLPERLYDGSSINTDFPEPGTFIIDEIHNLEPKIADKLNIYIDNGDFHIIGCTNNAGELPSAFRSRFRTLQLESYSSNDLQKIARNVCERKGYSYTNDALELLSLRSRFNARQLIQYLQMVFDILSVKGAERVSVEVVNETLTKLGVDAKGLLPRDRKYLEALSTEQSRGLQYLSAMLGINEKTIEEEVEPYLLRMGFIDRTSRGRIKIES